MHKVIVFGSLNMDLTIACERMPLAGETISGGGFLANPGGKGANQAVAAAKLGAQTQMIGAVGQDTFGDQLIAALAEAGVECKCVERVSGRPTGVACIVRVGPDNRIIVDPGANDVLRAEDVSHALDRLAGPGDIFLTQLECDHATTFAALAKARSRGMYVVLNAAPARTLPDDIWSNIDLVCINETECAAITGVYPDCDEAALRAMRQLADKGVHLVAVTLGERGAILLEDGRKLVSEPFHVNAIDTTCAGDTYLGAFIAARARGMSTEEIIRWSSCASALATTRIGAQQSIPSIAEVERLLTR
ncbi:PfkB domain protein [Coriobacterium glomerans PW2]|uniref:Ribokinase n=1 Tax=Coriobacterium glomerans (strain ATCC 49209 / DSM 20642 / JCM 10262 / PW2) TaxID=700015 RepID=F2NAN4_CORGP|nr:ribokinase [Coriobacterium glomerans]AEB07490.1 PfkB domain protein [Coriobacterium glomerans PW2]